MSYPIKSHKWSTISPTWKVLSRTIKRQMIYLREWCNSERGVTGMSSPSNPRKSKFLLEKWRRREEKWTKSTKSTWRSRNKLFSRKLKMIENLKKRHKKIFSSKCKREGKKLKVKGRKKLRPTKKNLMKLTVFFRSIKWRNPYTF